MSIEDIKTNLTTAINLIYEVYGYIQNCEEKEKESKNQ